MNDCPSADGHVGPVGTGEEAAVLLVICDGFGVGKVVVVRMVNIDVGTKPKEDETEDVGIDEVIELVDGTNDVENVLENEGVPKETEESDVTATMIEEDCEDELARAVVVVLVVLVTGHNGSPKPPHSNAAIACKHVEWRYSRDPWIAVLVGLSAVRRHGTASLPVLWMPSLYRNVSVSLRQAEWGHCISRFWQLSATPLIK